jgi:hypothetical protein
MLRFYLHVEWQGRTEGVEMSRNWVADYMQRSKQAHSDKRAKAQMVQVGAGGLFKMLADQVEQDIKEYHDLGGDAELRYEKRWDVRFRVFKSIYPAVDLVVSLESARVLCEYFFKESDVDKRRETRTYVRIVANESGSVQFFKNGEAYSETSEVSEVILAPVFSYVDASQ